MPTTEPIRRPVRQEDLEDWETEEWAQLKLLGWPRPVVLEVGAPKLAGRLVGD